MANERLRRALSGRALALPAAAALLCAAAPPALAQQQELEAVERALREDQSRAAELQRKAEALEREIQALRVESVAAARKAQDHESKLSAIEAQLAALERRESTKVADLKARRAQLGHTLAALQRIALQPVDALLFAPGSPIDTVRSGMLLRAAIPAIEQRAAALRGELDDLTELRRQIAVQRGKLAETAKALTGERERLSALIRRKSEARAVAAAEQEAAQARAARLAARAKDLRDLIETVEREAAAREAAERAAREAREKAQREAREQTARANRERAPLDRPPDSAEGAAPEEAAPAEAQVVLAKPANIRPFPASGASLIMPARGRLVLRYGQARGDDSVSRGIVIAARTGAQVVAPYDGKVVYAGTFRSYGQILIIEHGGRYHTLLAGLDRIDTVVGQWLLAGEPVGVLGAPSDGDPELYLELRHAGQPINPLPWLATTGDKVRG